MGGGREVFEREKENPKCYTINYLNKPFLPAWVKNRSTSAEQPLILVFRVECLFLPTTHSRLIILTLLPILASYHTMLARLL